MLYWGLRDPVLLNSSCFGSSPPSGSSTRGLGSVRIPARMNSRCSRWRHEESKEFHWTKGSSNSKSHGEAEQQPATLIHFQLAAKIRTPIIVVHDDSVRSSSLSLNHKDILNFMARNFPNNRILQIPKNSSWKERKCTFSLLARLSVYSTLNE